MIRHANMGDLTRITDIYNQAIKSRKATGDIEPFTAEQKEPWLSRHCKHERTPIFVYEDNGIVVGYCYLEAYRPGRQALESIAEISYYIDFGYHRMGIGSRLLQFTIQKTRNLRYKNLLAILLSCNDGSVALLKKHGFTLWGTLPEVACIDDNVYSHLYYGLNIENQ